MSIPTEFREFLRSHRGLPTLSVYLSGGLRDPAGQRAWRVELRHAIAVARTALHTPSMRDRQPFEACVTRLEQHLPDEHRLHAAGGWVCWSSIDGTVLDIVLDGHVGTSAEWRVGPVIVPYLASREEEPVFVLHLGRDSARLQRLLGDTLRTLDTLAIDPRVGAGDHMGAAPQPGFHPGTVGETLTDRAQRRQRSARQHLLSDIIERVTTRLSARGLLVTCGPEEVTAHFHGALPAHLAARTIAARNAADDAADGDILRHVADALETLRAARQHAWFTQLRERHHTDRHAAFGPVEVRTAVTVGAVEHVVISDRYLRAHRADAERLAQDALLHGARVSACPPHAEAELNQDAQGIAARLRFAVPRSETAPVSV